MSRVATLSRTTAETSIECSLDIDGHGRCDIQTGIGFLDHLLTALATHARFNLALRCKGDLEVDDHHSAEDCAIVLGQVFDAALADRQGIARFASAFAPLDESLARVVVDLCTRPSATIDLGLKRERLGELSCENIPHVLRTFAISARFTLHVDVLRGDNDHHRAEAAFKALALAIRQAVVVSVAAGPNSTKGVL